MAVYTSNNRAMQPRSSLHGLGRGTYAHWLVSGAWAEAPLFCTFLPSPALQLELGSTSSATKTINQLDGTSPMSSPFASEPREARSTARWGVAGSWHSFCCARRAHPSLNRPEACKPQLQQRRPFLAPQVASRSRSVPMKL